MIEETYYQKFGLFSGHKKSIKSSEVSEVK